MKMTGKPGQQVARFDMDDPEDLKSVTRSGLVWKSPYVNKAIALIRSGELPLAECKNIPDNIRAALEKGSK